MTRTSRAAVPPGRFAIAEPVRFPDDRPGFFAVFRKYSRRYIRRHFHALRVSRSGPVPDLPARARDRGRESRRRGGTRSSAWSSPRDARVARPLRADRREGAGPVSASWNAWGSSASRSGRRGAASPSCGRSLAILSRPESVLWITAQGEFVDVRERPTRLKEGIGHLAHRRRRGDHRAARHRVSLLERPLPRSPGPLRADDRDHRRAGASRPRPGPRGSSRRWRRPRIGSPRRHAAATPRHSSRWSAGQRAWEASTTSGAASARGLEVSRSNPSISSATDRARETRSSPDRMIRSCKD